MSGEDLEDLFENAPCGYLSLRKDGTIVKANRTLANWISSDAAALLGRRFLDLLSVAGKIYYETHFAPLLRMQGYFNEVALDLVKANGERIPVLINATERRDPAGEHLFTRLTIFNATDRRRYEAQLLELRAAAETSNRQLQELNATLETRVQTALAEQMRAEEALRQAQKMEAIGQLTGGVAHDFNNLLTLIIGGLDKVRRQVEGAPGELDIVRLRRATELALHGARRAATLTARLLAISRQQALAPRVVDPNRLLAGVADLLQRTLGESIAIETVTATGLWNTYIDPGELENVLINLAVNARDAMPSGGRLTIETANTSLGADYVATLAEPVEEGQYVLIAVSDTGCGMSAETLSKVFEPFFTTKDVGKGTGLGLAQVYGFIRQSRGHVRIYSQVGVGTTVKLFLPKATQTHGAATSDARSEAFALADVGGHETILVVEDDEDLRSYTVGILEELGYRVLQARSAYSALELLQTNQNIALLFTDIVLPEGLNGKQLADEAQRRRPGLKILFTTGYAKNAIAHNGHSSAIVNVVTKPFTFDELARRCRALLDS